MTVNTNGPEQPEEFGGIAPESSYYPDIPLGMRPEDVMVLENYVGEMAEYWDEDE